MSEDKPKIRSNIKQTVIQIGDEKVIFDQEEYTSISPDGDITSISSDQSLTVNGDRIYASDIRGNCELCDTLLIESTYVNCLCSRVIYLRCSRLYENILYCPVCFSSVRLRSILSATGRILLSPFRKGN